MAHKVNYPLRLQLRILDLVASWASIRILGKKAQFFIFKILLGGIFLYGFSLFGFLMVYDCFGGLFLQFCLLWFYLSM